MPEENPCLSAEHYLLRPFAFAQGDILPTVSLRAQRSNLQSYGRTVVEIAASPSAPRNDTIIPVPCKDLKS